MARPEQPVRARGYTMRARQESVGQTRLRITEATMALHERVGPRETTVSGIADEAGVTRLTVYRHFPDEQSLVRACSSHWRQLHPAPDPAEWTKIEDPVVRLRSALAQTYAWARTAAPMITKIERDLEVMPPFVAEHRAADEQARVAALVTGFRVRRQSSRRLAGALRHALKVSTWHSLCADGSLSDAEAVDVMVGAVLAAVDPPPRRYPDRTHVPEAKQ